MAHRLGLWGLVTTVILTGLSHLVDGGEAGRPTIVVEVFDQAALSPETLTQTKGEVSRIYGSVGVEVLWTNAKNAQGRFVSHLIIRPTPLPRMMGQALGDAHDTAGTAFVCRDRALDVARARNLEGACVLAYAMAPEIGHLLLPYPSHAATGIMHGDWDGADYERMRTGSLHFTPAQASAIRAMWGGYGQERLAAQNAEAPLPRQEASSAGADQNRTERPTLLIHVDDQTHLGARDRDAAEKEVVRQTSPVGPHVRTEDPTLRKLISRGLTESPTFRKIVCRIDRLGGLVHVVASRCGSLSRLSACLDHDVRVRGGIRYLRINMLPGEPEARQLRLLAHELQHALEVLSDETATSQESVTRLYERIGMRRPGVGNFETDAALRVQKEVARELRSYRKTTRSAVVTSGEACAAEP